MQQDSPSTLWDATREAFETVGPWGFLGGLTMVVWRIINGAYSSAVQMRTDGYVAELGRLEKERARMVEERAKFDADRAAWNVERLRLLDEIDKLRREK